VLDFDGDGNIIADSYDPDVSGAYATDDQGVADLGAAGMVDPEIQQIVDAIEEQIILTESNVFGVSDVFLNGNRLGTADPDDPDGVRTQETNLGDLTADANLALAQEVDSTVLVSIKNGGGIRDSIGQVYVPTGGEYVRLPNEEIIDSDGNLIKPAGGISENDIKAVLAFNNGLSLLTLTKAELVAVLEHGVANEGGGQFEQVSGVKLSYDPDLPAGDRILNAGIFDQDGNLIAELVRDGEIVGDENQTFRVVTLNFLADGGDGYPFPTGPEADRVNLYDLDGDGVNDDATTGDATFAFDGTEQDALAEYLADNFYDPAHAYDQEDVGRDLDERIQNLDFRGDSVFDGIVTPAELVINEVRIDQPGTDNDEYFELFGAANQSLDGLTYLVIGDGTGGSGVIEAVVDLTGQSLDGDGFFLAAESTFTLSTADLTTSLNFENSDNVTHLLVRDFSGSNGDDLDTNDDGVLDATPWSEVLDSVALVTPTVPGSSEYVYSTNQVGPDDAFVPGHVFRLPDGGDWQIGPFDPANGNDTPGEANDDTITAPLAAAIYEIQGAAHRSPLEGSRVVTSGIVTAIVAGSGFYLQDAVGDGDIATSDGIFVYGDPSGLAVGNEVEVTGTVSEYQFPPALSVTEIVAENGKTAVLSTGNDLPEAVLLGHDRIQPHDVIDDDGLTSFDPTTDAIDFLESLEGMRVAVNDPLVVAGTSRFGEVALAAGRAGEFGSTNVNAVISEGDFNPEILLTDDVIVTAPDATTGDVFLTDAVGVLDYTFGAYKLQLTEAPIVISGERTPEVPALTGDADHLTIATYNTFNLDPSDGDPGGAFDRLDALAQSIVNNLQSPDIIALEEIQDNSGETDDGIVDASQTLQELVDAISAAGGPTYAFAEINPNNNEDGGAPGANIRSAFLYNPMRVDLDEASLQRIDNDAFDAGGDGSAAEANYEGTRKPLVGEFTFIPSGDTVTVIGNHLKSKSQDDGLYGENQPPVENTLAQRVDQAEVINDFVADFLSTHADAKVIVLGDMNDFQFSATLDALKNGNGGDAELINLVDNLPTEDQYSFIFNRNSQQLDHILVNEAIAANAEIDVVHINLDFGFPADNPSDHDPVVALIDLSDHPAAV
jgi:predicted extracellular nuclease